MAGTNDPVSWAVSSRPWVVASIVGALVLAMGAAVTVWRHEDGPARGSLMMGSTSPMGSTSEYDYLAHMVAHHQEAITAASQLARSRRPALRALGADIVASQSAQVDQMTAWTKDWYPSRPTVAADYQPQMRDLTGLTGDDLDRAFLTDMVPHHMMAVMMSQRLLAAGDLPHDQVTALARRIIVEQRAEILTMRGWLRTWFGESAPGMSTSMMGW